MTSVSIKGKSISHHYQQTYLNVNIRFNYHSIHLTLIGYVDFV
jgi:hypothetical protein